MENLPQEIIQSRIYEIRNLKVMLDSDLAKLYEVETKRINEAWSGNINSYSESFNSEYEFMLPLQLLNIEKLKLLNN